jgi:WD40 repeat protein
MLKHTLEKEYDWVLCVAMSEDSNLIVSGVYGQNMHVWCAHTGKHMCTVQAHNDGVRCVDFKGKSLLVSGGGDRTIKVWELGDGTNPMLLYTVWGHTDVVFDTKFSRDGMKIASCSGDKTIMIWNVQTSQQLLTLRGHDDCVWSVAWSSDSRLIASGGEDKTIRIWDTDRGMQINQPLVGHECGVSAVVFSSTTALLVSASRDMTVMIWGLDEEKNVTVRHRLHGCTGIVNSVSMSRDDRLIASASRDWTVRVWDAATGQLLRVLEGHTGQVSSVTWSRCGQYILSGAWDGTVRMWEADVQVSGLDVCMYVCWRMYVCIIRMHERTAIHLREADVQVCGLDVCICLCSCMYVCVYIRLSMR